MTDIFKKEGFLVTMDIEKPFNSLDHAFYVSLLIKFRFGNNFVYWIETFISKNDSCIINAGNATQHFYLKRGTHQGDPISTYVLIFALEVYRNNIWIEKIKISRGSIFLSIYFCIQHIAITQLSFLKTRNQ